MFFKWSHFEWIFFMTSEICSLSVGLQSFSPNKEQCSNCAFCFQFFTEYFIFFTWWFHSCAGVIRGGHHNENLNFWPSAMQGGQITDSVWFCLLINLVFGNGAITADKTSQRSAVPWALRCAGGLQRNPRSRRSVRHRCVCWTFQEVFTKNIQADIQQPSPSNDLFAINCLCTGPHGLTSPLMVLVRYEAGAAKTLDVTDLRTGCEALLVEVFRLCRKSHFYHRFGPDIFEEKRFEKISWFVGFFHAIKCVQFISSLPQSEFRFRWGGSSSTF